MAKLKKLLLVMMVCLSVQSTAFALNEYQLAADYGITDRAVSVVRLCDIAREQLRNECEYITTLMILKEIRDLVQYTDIASKLTLEAIIQGYIEYETRECTGRYNGISLYDFLINFQDYK